VVLSPPFWTPTSRDEKALIDFQVAQSDAIEEGESMTSTLKESGFI